MNYELLLDSLKIKIFSCDYVVLKGETRAVPEEAEDS